VGDACSAQGEMRNTHRIWLEILKLIRERTLPEQRRLVSVCVENRSTAGDVVRAQMTYRNTGRVRLGYI
jgi:hypothetical protein